MAETPPGGGRGVSHLAFRYGYHSGRGNHGNGTCCHGNIGGSAPSDQASITWHVNQVIGLGDLLWLSQNPYISILLPCLTSAIRKWHLNRFLMPLDRASCISYPNEILMYALNCLIRGRKPLSIDSVKRQILLPTLTHSLRLHIFSSLFMLIITYFSKLII